MMQVERQDVQVRSDGLLLVGDLWQPTEPSTEHRTVYLLHGGGQTRRSWRSTGEDLARQGYRCLAFDARGHGESDWSPTGNYTMDSIAGDLRTILDTFGRAISLVGASMGGLTSLVALGEDSTIADSLALVDITPFSEPVGIERIRAFMTGTDEGFATLEEAATAIAAYNPHRKSGGSLDGLKKVLRLIDGRYHWHWDPAFMPAPRQEPTLDTREHPINERRIRDLAATITVPTLLVRGGGSDIVSDSSIERTRALMPQLEAIAVGGAGHMVAGDDNGVFAAGLLEFLGRHFG